MSGAALAHHDARARFDKLGVLIMLISLYALIVAPFVTFRANRIIAGDGVGVVDALPGALALGLFALFGMALAVALSHAAPIFRLGAGLLGLVALFVAVGLAGTHLTPEGDKLARVSPASGFWLLLLAFALLVTDAIARLKLSPLVRVVALVAGLAALYGALASGLWDDLSLLKEYGNRAASFWAEAATHLKLAAGSMAAAVLVGIPLGLICYRVPGLRSVVLNLLNTIQTIPSMAMFGLLIAPLGWVAANLPGAKALGIAGIGAAPAFVALFLYSLLPVVANTVAGLAGVPEHVREAARGMGMTPLQRLARVELPLALPVLLTGIRIVLVQNIGLVTIAALIGGGGFGVFVFQGIGQMASDLVLLGALPTVMLAFSAAILLDALIDIVSPPKGATR